MGLVEIKEALRRDAGFRSLFPEYAAEVRDFLRDTACPCNAALFRKVAAHADRIANYFDGKSVPVAAPVPDEFVVVNTGIDSLEGVLRDLSSGARVEALARYQDQVTVVIRVPR